MHTLTKRHFHVRVGVNNLQELVHPLTIHEGVGAFLSIAFLERTNLVHQRLEFSFVQHSISIVINGLELPHEEGEELFMLVELEVQDALEEGDEFEFVRLARGLLLVELISGELFVNRRPLG